MVKFKILIFSMLLVVATGCKTMTDTSNEVKTVQKTDSKGFQYEIVTNDPTGLRLYTLENGLQVYLSKNTEEPKIQTYIAVRAGSNYDPKKSTGLAHYLEHMLFKGTEKIGTLDWEKEKVLLDKISDLYEKHRQENDPDKKKEIYKEIDKVSLEASGYSVANEYDKMINSLGATGTNAHTWMEETVYHNKIPSNELNKWIQLEADRFSKLVLRLFHTELEAVYEEFNGSQDNDYRKAHAAKLDGLFPNHPYGQQTTIGISEHLKNPSMVDIHEYFEKYYVPNNMAIVLVGDLNFEKTISKINETFGKFERKELVHPVLPKEAPITSPVIKEVYGPTAESISIAYRSAGVSSDDQKFVTLCDMILSNGKAGLLDLNLNQKQKVQRSSSYPTFQNDYGFHSLSGSPKLNQTLDEVKDLLLEQIEILKEGKFEDWMIEAVVNDLKLRQTKDYEKSTNLAGAYYNAFIHRQKWEDKVKFLDELKNVTKQELVDFANRFYQNNYVVTYKRKGEDKNIVKVENPKITPVELNRDKSSDYVKAFNQMKSNPIQPQVIDYKSSIKKSKTSKGIEVSYILNEKNDLFDLNIIFDMGRDHDKKLSLAVGYLEYLGTDKYSPEEIKKEFYKLGINYYVSTQNDKTYVGLRGLKENLSKGLVLLEHLWDHAKPNQDTYDKYVEKIYKGRQDKKINKSSILWSGLMSYGRYGEDSRMRDIYQIDELKEIDPKELVGLIKDMKNYKQRVFYYGKDIEQLLTEIDTHHKVYGTLKEYPEKKEYKELETGGNVFFTNYDMVQAEMLFLSKGKDFDAKDLAASTLFNSYFGGGMSSVVFQEIRESKSLAYSASAGYSNASKKEAPNYVYAYIGTQANKLPQAVTAMMELMNDMPEAEKQFENAKEAVLKKLAAQRISKSDIFWAYESLKKKGIDYDNRKEIYDNIKKMSLQDLKTFFNENIKGASYNVMVIGNKKDLDANALQKLGNVKELDVDYLFNYSDKTALKK